MYANQPLSRRIRLAVATLVAAGFVAACNTEPISRATGLGQQPGRSTLQVRVAPATAQMKVGETLILRAEVRDGYGNLVPDLVPSWESGETAVVIVSPDGLVARVTAIGTGEARVTARAQDALGSASVAVIAADVSSQS